MTGALNKAKCLFSGCENLTIAVDHKPLLRILRNRSLEAKPIPRLRNLKEKHFAKDSVVSTFQVSNTVLLSISPNILLTNEICSTYRTMYHKSNKYKPLQNTIYYN